MAEREKITKTLLESISPPCVGQVFIRDTEIRGFGLRVTPTRKTFILERRICGKPKRYTIGPYPDISVSQARKRAQELISAVVLGDVSAIDKSGSVTLREAYRARNGYKKLRPSTVRGYDAAMDNTFESWLDRPLTAISTEDVMTKFFARSKASPSKANHDFRLLGAVYHFARKKYGVTHNPVQALGDHGVWNKDERRKSYIKPHHLRAWYRAVVELGGIAPSRNDEIARDYLRLLLFTGMRREEAAQIQKSWIDIEGCSLHVPGAVTKNGEPLDLPLSLPAFEIVRRRCAETPNGFLFWSSRSRSGYVRNVQYQVSLVIKDSGVQFTLHDLRRTFITIAESLDISTIALKRMLNHKQSGVTEGYIMPSLDRLRDPIKAVADEITRLVR